MSEHDGHEHAHHHHHHDCGNLFGCGDEKGTGIVREDIKDAAFDKRVSDRLLHMDEVDQETFDSYLSVRGRNRRKFLLASSFMGALAAVATRSRKRCCHTAGDRVRFKIDCDNRNGAAWPIGPRSVPRGRSP
jgi:hypothetical protein